MNRETYEKAVKLHEQITQLSDLITTVNNNQLTFIDHLGNCTNNSRLRQIAEQTKLEREIEEL